jgi:hypothetical protein
LVGLCRPDCRFLLTRSGGYQGTGLEVEDSRRLGVTLIAGRGIEDDAVREAVEREFSLAGVEMTEGGDPREREALVIWMGETDWMGEEPDGWSSFKLSSYRMEFWRPVRYRVGESERLTSGMTWVMRGTAGGGYRQRYGHTPTEINCYVVAENVRNFLTQFLEANGETYSTPDSPPACRDD